VTVTARYDAADTNFGTAETSATIDLAGGAATSPTAATPTESADQADGGITSQIRSVFTIPVIAALLTGVILLVLEVTVRRLGLFSDNLPESERTTVTTDINESQLSETTDVDESQSPETTDTEPTSTDDPTDRMGQALAQRSTTRR
jgi:hypothetical protein